MVQIPRGKILSYLFRHILRENDKFSYFPHFSGKVLHQLYRVQLVEGESYKQEAMSRQLRATTINANRGTIYSADGQILAASATSWRVIFSPADITDEQATLLADGMSEILGVDREFILERAGNKKSFYQVIKSRVDKETADAAYQFALDNKINGHPLLPLRHHGLHRAGLCKCR